MWLSKNILHSFEGSVSDVKIILPPGKLRSITIMPPLFTSKGISEGIKDGTGSFVIQISGDINLDGIVDMNDATTLLQYSIFPDIYPIKYTGNVDFTGDGEIDMNDAVLLLQHSMFPDLFPIE